MFLVSGVVIVIALGLVIRNQVNVSRNRAEGEARAQERARIRTELAVELQPVTLSNCTLARIGASNDGGYLMCANLLEKVQSAYSYGIAGDDNWGCSVSTRFNVPVHQYDCFDPTRPPCPTGRPTFHDECIGPKTETVESRFFDTLTKQIEKNEDTGKMLVMKMDVEGAELESLMTTSDDVLNRIDQLAIELHAPDRPNLDLVRRLKRFFHVAHLHFNNSRCGNRWKPFPSQVYEVLFVNKRVGVVAANKPRPTLPHSLDAQNTLFRPDCQALLPVGP